MSNGILWFRIYRCLPKCSFLSTLKDKNQVQKTSPPHKKISNRWYLKQKLFLHVYHKKTDLFWQKLKTTLYRIKVALFFKTGIFYMIQVLRYKCINLWFHFTVSLSIMFSFFVQYLTKGRIELNLSIYCTVCLICTTW